MLNTVAYYYIVDNVFEEYLFFCGTPPNDPSPCKPVSFGGSTSLYMAQILTLLVTSFSVSYESIRSSFHLRNHSVW